MNDFKIFRVSHTYVAEPLTLRAEEWLDKIAHSKASRVGKAVGVHPDNLDRFLGDLKTQGFEWEGPIKLNRKTLECLEIIAKSVGR